MTWPREQGHISQTKDHRPLKFSENLAKSFKRSCSKNQISSFKNVAYSAQNLPRGGIPPCAGEGLGTCRLRWDSFKNYIDALRTWLVLLNLRSCFLHIPLSQCIDCRSRKFSRESVGLHVVRSHVPVTKVRGSRRYGRWIFMRLLAGMVACDGRPPGVSEGSGRAR